jgi:hypothetical protein
MGHQVIKLRIPALLALSLAAAPSVAQTGTTAPAEPARGAATFDAMVSTDADETEVVRTGINLDWSYLGEDRYQGVRIEKAWFTPLGQQTTGFERIYARYADKNDRWAWKGQIGTDGDTVLGSFNLADTSRYRKEFFVERDILETPRGVTEGIYYTFGGVALDVPLGERDTAVLVLGAQEFTGKNVRLHVRGNYIHVVKPDWGLTAQLRGRYFHSTEPGEYDYFSPRWYAEVLPVVQLRRYSNGWRYLLAAGYGAQANAGSDWRPSRYLNAQVSSPDTRPVWFRASVVYSNTPVGTGAVYDYLQGSLSLTTRF